MFRSARRDPLQRLCLFLDRCWHGPRGQAIPFTSLQLEQLETRSLLSASGTSLTIDPGSTSVAGMAQPLGTATPLTSSGGMTYYTPAEIRHAYGVDQATLPNGQAATGAGETIAVIVAGDDPNIANDLAVFSATFGLPQANLLEAVQGYTPAGAGWASETALDVEWAHAIAPQATILLVEARSGSYSDLLTCANWAASVPSVVAVSMSWGGPEFSGETSYDQYLTTSPYHVGGWGQYGGVTFVSSAGDNGAWSGPLYPASSPNVLSVGGTSLYLNSNSSYGVEGSWLYGGGGYSTHEPEASYQLGAQNSLWRTSPDVAYDANPSTGVLIYNTYGQTPGSSGWWIAGGTSAGAPQWAGILALADEARNSIGEGSLGNAQASLYYLPSSDFHDVIYGTNGYAATPGYDLSTGRGTPYADRIVHDLLYAPTAGAVSLLWTPVSASAQTAGIAGVADEQEPILVSSSDGSSQAAEGLGTSLQAPQLIVKLSELSMEQPAVLGVSSASSTLSDRFWQNLPAQPWNELESSLISLSLLGPSSSSRTGSSSARSDSRPTAPLQDADSTQDQLDWTGLQGKGADLH